MDILPWLGTLTRPGEVGGCSAYVRTNTGQRVAVRLTTGTAAPPPPTIPAQLLDDVLILEWYRVRWQVELAFKRIKSLAGLGHLPKYDASSSRAWLYGKLLVALMTERMQRYAGAFSPWGTRWFDQDPPAESLA